jgi:hypothetical protein
LANPHTQLIGIEGGEAVWAGALGEELMHPSAPPNDTARTLLGSRLLTGARLWQIIWPGGLLISSTTGQFSTVYMSDALRPWLVVGELVAGDLLGAPLNEAGNRRWFTPTIYAAELRLTGAKNSIVELAHIWALPASITDVTSIDSGAQPRLEQAMREYFDL